MKTVRQWEFRESLQGWCATRHIDDLAVRNGSLTGTITGHDPQLTSPLFELSATAYQEVWARVRCSQAGHGELFYSNTTETQYGGFSGEKMVRYTVAEPGQWQTVKIRPWWQAEGTIIHIRFDLYAETDFEIAWLRIVEPDGADAPLNQTEWLFPEALGTGWEHEGNFLTSPPLAVPVSERGWLVLGVACPTEAHVVIRWATDHAAGLQTRGFYIPGDTAQHWYSLDMGVHSGWCGNLLHLSISATGQYGTKPQIHFLSLRQSLWEDPDPQVLYFGPQDAVNRVGTPCTFFFRIRNNGDTPATEIRAKLRVVDGDRELPLSDPELTFDVRPGIPVTRTLSVIPPRPGTLKAVLDLETTLGTRTFTSRPMDVLPSVTDVSQGRVPVPKPAMTDYFIGAYYYPGFETERQWRQLERTAPWAKPVLGYYDEANSECVDWQIKWAVEHGISFFLIDWYWVAGRMWHTHYIDALKKSRYREYMKWAVMWANHNPAGTHTEADWRKVTRFWIENYFSEPEYLRRKGCPVVAIWSAGGLRRDMGGTDAAERMLELSQQMARDAGFPGIHFVAMNNAGAADVIASEGYASWTSYHWWSDCRNLVDDVEYFPFSLVVDRSRKGWDARHAALSEAGLGLLPVADTGWDARPRHGDNTFVIYGRTPEQFQRLLTDAKNWLDENSQKMLILGPWNEWTEGSYIEPCTEFGFGMLQAVHNTFCSGPLPDIVGPKDVGLGPYDFDLTARGASQHEWDFGDKASGEAWRPLMGLSDVRVEQGMLVAETTTHDPAFQSRWLELDAAKFSRMEVTLAVDPEPTEKDTVALFWATATSPITGKSHVETRTDCKEGLQTVNLEVGKHPRWRGIIRYLRLDPCRTADRRVSIKSIRLIPTAE